MTVAPQQLAAAAVYQADEPAGMERRRRHVSASAIVFWTSAAILSLAVIVAILAPVLAPYDPLQQTPAARLGAASAAHPLGLDALGRDILSRLLWGARASLGIAAGAVLISGISGTLLGMIAARIRGFGEWLIVWMADLLLSFPTLILALAIVIPLGPGVRNVIAALSVSFLPRFIRLTLSSAKRVEEMGYVEACRVLAASDARIVLRHVLPNISGPLIVLAALLVGTSIEIEAGLSFLGLGVPPPQSSWGLMLHDALGYIITVPQQVIFPAVAIILCVLSINLFGDGLRERLDPLLRRI
jgi:peptide/nickel transport system permease protein